MFNMAFFAELAAFLLGVIYLLLISKKKKEGWYYGMASCAILTVLCFSKGHLAQGTIQGMNAIMGIYGLRLWERKELTSISKPAYLVVIVAVAPAIFLLSSWLFPERSWIDQLDNLTLVLSIVATLFTVFLILENWHLWAIVNALTVLTASWHQLYLLSALSMAYLLLSCYGFYQWKR